MNPRRRDFITLLGGTAAWPLAARAQQPATPPRIGLLMAGFTQTDREGQARVAAFLEAFQRLGWTDGRNVQIASRWFPGSADGMKASTEEMVRSAPAVIVVQGGTALTELQRLTNTVPIVFTQVSDPVADGHVASLARPGGNTTGFQSFETAIGGKWLGVLKEAAPKLSRVAVLFGSRSLNNVATLHAAEAVAASLGVTVTPVDVDAQGEIEHAIATFAGLGDGGLVVAQHPATISNRASIILSAARYRLPAIYPYRYFAAEGGLMSYGPDQIDDWRRAAAYVDRILKGKKPGDLPVQAPTRYELVINMKTAKVLGFDISPGLPLRADEVIE
jgi:putative ABC transport system substrate-binding protein